MFNHILIATDGSKLADHAVEYGLTLAKALKAKVTTVTVTEPFHVFAIDPQAVTDTPAEYAKHARQHAERVLDAASRAAKAIGIECNPLQMEHDHPYEAIIKAAHANGCDAIVMASHGHRGVAGLVLGSQTVKVLTHSKLPVLVCH